MPAPPPSPHLAVDLGAESGRVMLGTADAGRIGLQEIHRWPSRRVQVLESRRWDLLFMWGEMLEGLRKAAAMTDAARIRSVSVNSWAVDYVLLKDGHPYLTPPFMYRDERVDKPFSVVMADEGLQREVFEETGIQFLPFNTAWQLQADAANLLETADGLLLIADYFNSLLGGGRLQERSNASTTQLYNPRTRRWSRSLLERLGLPGDLLPELCDAGKILGTISPEVVEQTGLRSQVQVVATCSHDTGNAVAGTPLSPGGAYLSSGTWSLLGVEAAVRAVETGPAPARVSAK